jgi:hypothetical protein
VIFLNIIFTTAKNYLITDQYAYYYLFGSLLLAPLLYKLSAYITRRFMLHESEKILSALDKHARNVSRIKQEQK